MTPPTSPCSTPPSGTLLARAALALYPPSWRARYENEDPGAPRRLLRRPGRRGQPRLAGALGLDPPALHDRPARMRSSLATALMAWSMLTGLGLVFAQLTQLQGFTALGHPVFRWAYAVFDVSLALSVLVAGFGGLPLWLLMMRRAWRERRPRDMVYLLLPLIAPAGWLLALIVTIRLLNHGPNGFGPWWVCPSSWPGSPRPPPRPPDPAWPCAGCSHGGQPCAWPPPRPEWPRRSWRWRRWPSRSRSSACACVPVHFAGYHHGTVPGIYLALVAAAATVTTVSAARGSRAALAEP